MFKILQETSADRVTIGVGGRSFEVPAGMSVAGALLANGFEWTRQAANGTRRGPFCLMGACFECILNIDGKPNQRACQVQVRDGMRVERQFHDGGPDVG